MKYGLPDVPIRMLRSTVFLETRHGLGHLYQGHRTATALILMSSRDKSLTSKRIQANSIHGHVKYCSMTYLSFALMAETCHLLTLTLKQCVNYRVCLSAVASSISSVHSRRLLWISCKPLHAAKIPI